MIAKPNSITPLILAFALSQPSATPGQEAQENSKAVVNQAVELLIFARQSAKEVEDREYHDVSMGDIAQDFGKLGQTTAARETFALIIDNKWRDYSLKPFLETQLKAKDFGDAQLTVEAMSTAQGKAEALCALASTQWEFGRRDTAKKTLAGAEKIFAQNKQELSNAEFLEVLALTQDELGDTGKARATKQDLSKISGGHVSVADKWDFSWLSSDSGKLRQAGRAEMKNGDLPAARASLQRAANEIESVDAGARPTLLYMIGSDQAAAGDENGARDTFLRADEKAESLPERSRDLILRDVVREQAAAGYIEDSLKAVTNIRDDHLKWQALHGIAVSQTRKTGVESGLITAGQIRSESEYDMTLVDIAQVLGRQMEVARIYRIVELIHSPYMKSRALIEAAESMTGTAEPDKVD